MTEHQTLYSAEPGPSAEDAERIVLTFNALWNAIHRDPAAEEVGRCFETFADAYTGPTREFVEAFAPVESRRRWVGELFVHLSREIPPQVWSTAPPPPPPR